jgi:acetylglutamate kinase
LNPVVLKVGGRELAIGPELEQLARLVAGLESRGRRVVVVHGGGEEVTDRAEALGLRTTRHRGLRVTSAPMLEVVVEVLAGRVNTRLVAALGKVGVPAVGLSGADSRLLTVRPAGEPAGALGFVGVPHEVHPGALAAVLTAGLTPVVAPLGVDAHGQVHNVNADLAASALAAALGAELYLVTDVPGVRDRSGRVRATLNVTEARRLVESGAATDGMIPKLEAVWSALAEGAPGAWIGPLSGLSPEGPKAGAGTTLRLSPNRPGTVPLLLPPFASGRGS